MLANLISSIVLVFIAIIMCYSSIRIGLGTFRVPGTGFVPFITAVFLGVCSLCILVRTGVRKKAEETFPREWTNMLNMIKVVVGLIIYILLLDLLGYVIGTFLLMLFFFRAVWTLKWRWALITSILTVLISYLVFDVYFQCLFPVGLIDLRDLLRWIL